MKRLFLLLLNLVIIGCVGASTFGMKQESYERNLLSLENKTIDTVEKKGQLPMIAKTKHAIAKPFFLVVCKKNYFFCRVK